MGLYKNLKDALLVPNDVTTLKLKITKGKIPEELFCFSYLEELFLEGSGKLASPAHFEGFENLRRITLKGFDLSEIIQRLWEIPELENIKIIDGKLTRLLLPLANYPALKFLTIKNTELEEIPMEISQLVNLQELTIIESPINKLPVGILDLKDLKRLNLDNNQLSTLPDWLKKHSSLKALSLDNNPLSEDEKDRLQREFNLWF